MYAKVEIKGVIELCTGMHIGGNSQFAAIGAVDSSVVRDPLSDKPMIPGSSLKGKMRTLLAKRYNPGDRRVASPKEDDIRILRLFGPVDNHRGRLVFSDMFLCNMEELKGYGLHTPTEVKFENTINRLTGVANPRQIERAVRGSKYELHLIYDAEEEADVKEDFQTISEGMKLLQMDYLGGSGSRGYGKIKFENLEADVVVGDMSDELLEHCNDLLKEV